MTRNGIHHRLSPSLLIVELAGFGLVLVLAGLIPAGLTETWFARQLFPLIAETTAVLAEAVPFSILDPLLFLSAGLFAYFLYRLWLLRAAALLGGLYLIFLLGWGLNYHRPPLERRNPVLAAEPKEEDLARFQKFAASELNRLYKVKQTFRFEPSHAEEELDERVRTVIHRVDGIEWQTPRRSKRSPVFDPLIRAAGVDGFFNPFGHEAIVNSRLLPVERPFVVAHELAHVRGYADEGEANFIAFLANAGSSNPMHQYSAWIGLWPYFNDGVRLLDAGPVKDLNEIRDRIRASRKEPVQRIQTAAFGAYLKANQVPEGLRSYDKVLRWAVAASAHFSIYK